MNKKVNINLKNPKINFLLIFFGIVFLFISFINITKVISRGVVGDIEKGLVGHWLLDGEHGASDITPYGRNGITYGAILSTGVRGEGSGSYSFDGVDDYIDLNYGAGINPATTPHSFSMWVKTDSPASSRIFMTSGQSGGVDNRFYLGTNGGKWDMGIQIAGWGSGTISATTNWTHILVVMNGSVATMYVNGIVGRTINYASYNLNRDIFLGNHDNNYWFDGSISDVRIYKRVLSTTEIKSLYDSYKPSLSATSLNKGLIVHYPLDGEYSTEATTNLWTSVNGRPESLTPGGTTPPTVELINQTTPFGTQIYKVTIPANNDTGYFGCRVTGPNATMYYDGRPYSYFTYVSGDLSGVSIYPTGSRGQAACSYDFNKNKNEWKYYIRENVIDSSGGSGGLYMSWYASNTSTSARIFYVAATQLEQKNHATPFVSGTRNSWIEDKSGNGKHGINSNTILSVGRKGEANGSTYFDGAITTYVTLPTSTINGLGDYSISLWVKSTDTTKNLNSIVSGTKSGSNTFLIYLANASIGSYMNDNNYNIATANHNNNQWYYVVMTRSGSTCKFYEDNVLKSTVSCINNVIDIDGGNLLLGQEQDTVGGGFDVTQSLSGSLSDLRIYNRALSDSEIKTIYESVDPKLSAGTLNKGLILDAPLTNSFMQSATIVSDGTPYANHGTVYNGAIVGNDGTTFDGLNDYLDFNSVNNDLNPRQGSISLWVKKNGSSYYVVSSNLNYRTYINSTNTFSFTKGNPPTGIVSSVVSDNVWYHIGFTWDDSQTMRAYINGDLINTGVFVSTDVSGRFLLGSFNGVDQYFAGSISNLKVYNRTLSADEMKLLYDKGRY